MFRFSKKRKINKNPDKQEKQIMLPEDMKKTAFNAKSFIIRSWILGGFGYAEVVFKNINTNELLGVDIIESPTEYDAIKVAYDKIMENKYPDIV